MGKRFFRVVLSFFSLLTCRGQAVHPPVRAAYVQLGAYSKKFADPFSFGGNAAALASITQFSAGIYSEQRFLLKALNLSTLAVAVPLKTGGIGVQVAYFGSGGYSESESGMAYAKKLGGIVDLGIQFNYYRVSIAGYSGGSAINFAIGAMLHPSAKIQLGFHAYNPVGGKLGKSGTEKLASIYSMGIGYEATEQVYLCAEIVKEEERPVNVFAALHYAFARQFFARIGMVTASASPFAAAGLRWSKIRLDITVSYHPQLGFTPGLMLLYYFKSETG